MWSDDHAINFLPKGTMLVFVNFPDFSGDLVEIDIARAPVPNEKVMVKFLVRYRGVSLMRNL